MVHLVLSTTRGNSGNRYFPHQGYLGLTPVRVEGVVRTKLDEDGKPIPARALSISIRCYQSRLTRSRSIRSTLVVDHTDVLWVKPQDREYADVAELEFPFKLTLPKRTPGFSTANYQDYRVFWRLEAVLDHVYIPSVGSRIVRYYDLGLVRYDLPPSRPLKPPPSNSSTSSHALPHQTSKPRAPVVRYNVSVPTTPVGPADIIFATISVQPLDRGVSVRSATVSVERRIDLHNTPAAPTPLVTTGINHSAAPSPSPTATLSPASPTPSSHSGDHSSEDASTPTTSRFGRDRLDIPTYSSSSQSFATFDSLASNYSSSSTRPLLSPSSSDVPTPPIPIPRSHSSPAPTPSPSSSFSFSPLTPSPSASSESLLKTLSSTLVSAEATSFTCDPSGVWTRTVSLQWPENRGHYRWAVGETMQSDFASVRFLVRTKLVVHGPGGTDALELEPKELTIVSTNDADRRNAMEKWAEQKETALRNKSKSPWRRRGEELSGPESTGPSSSNHRKESGYGLPSPPQTPAQSSEGSDGRKLSSAHGSSSGASKPPRKKTSRRPHTSAGPRDKSNFAYSAPTGEMRVRSDPDRDALASRGSASSSSASHGDSHGHSHVGRRLKESGLGESMLYAVEMERERRERPKSTGLGLQLGLERDQVRAWEEELARIELQSRRSSAGMLGSWGTSRRRNGG
ncbi:hypothetical protein C8Q73DRAFT_637542 [Cubamyces lactineus]|nr:hypothetical protein C8Q73DRAFT_637542 [Cubamyces lactineus]